jgi:hypothetical protein
MQNYPFAIEKVTNKTRWITFLMSGGILIHAPMYGSVQLISSLSYFFPLFDELLNSHQRAQDRPQSMP